MSVNRRSLITGLISLVAAPAIVRAANIMPVRSIPPLWGRFDRFAHYAVGDIVKLHGQTYICTMAGVTAQFNDLYHFASFPGPAP